MIWSDYLTEHQKNQLDTLLAAVLDDEDPVFTDVNLTMLAGVDKAAIERQTAGWRFDDSAASLSMFSSILGQCLHVPWMSDRAAEVLGRADAVSKLDRAFEPILFRAFGRRSG
jgi:hypothetical protein